MIFFEKTKMEIMRKMICITQLKLKFTSKFLLAFSVY